MPSTASPSLRVELMATGEKLNVWGEDLNDVIERLEEAVAGVLPKSLTGNVTLTSTNYVSNEYRHSTLVFTDGGLSSAPTVTVPAVEKNWIVHNKGSTYNVNISCGGTAAAVLPGQITIVYCDGTNCFAGTDAAQALASATAAAASAAAALASQNAAAASFDSFDDRYLGSKTADPTLDNDGNALLTGALYWNSVANEMRAYNGSAWLAAYLPAAAYLLEAGDTMTGALNWATAATVASATTTDIGAAASNLVTITGTTTITGLGAIAAGAARWVRFSGALTLTHNGTSLILPGSASITTAAGDTALFVSEGSGNWRCYSYQRASGSPVRFGVTRSARTSNTILGVADSGVLIDVTSGTFTQTLTAAATLGANWFCYFKNSGTGVVTIDPNSTEQIDGRTTISVYPGESFLIQCDSAAFFTVGRDRLPLIQSQTTGAAVASVDFTQGINDAELSGYVLEMFDVDTASSAVLSMRVSVGGVFQTSGYLSQVHYNSSSTVIATVNSIAGTSFPFEGAANTGVRTGIVEIARQDASATNIMGHARVVSDVGPTLNLAGLSTAPAGIFDGIRILASTGNIASGSKFRLYGKRF